MSNYTNNYSQSAAPEVTMERLLSAARNTKCEIGQTVDIEDGADQTIVMAEIKFNGYRGRMVTNGFYTVVMLVAPPLLSGCDTAVYRPWTNAVNAEEKTVKAYIYREGAPEIVSVIVEGIMPHPDGLSDAQLRRWLGRILEECRDVLDDGIVHHFCPEGNFS